MIDTATKIRFKIGQLEVEFEGEESFLKNDLSNILNLIAGLTNEHFATQSVHSSAAPKEVVDSAGSQPKFDLSTSTIASLMGAKTGPDLVVAASAHLYFVQGKEKFSRAEIYTEMKTATDYYNANIGGNLSMSLKSLVRKRHLNGTASDTYALTVNEKDHMEKLFAQRHRS